MWWMWTVMWWWRPRDTLSVEKGAGSPEPYTYSRYTRLIHAEAVLNHPVSARGG